VAFATQVTGQHRSTGHPSIMCTDAAKAKLSELYLHDDDSTVVHLEFLPYMN